MLNPKLLTKLKQILGFNYVAPPVANAATHNKFLGKLRTNLNNTGFREVNLGKGLTHQDYQLSDDISRLRRIRPSLAQKLNDTLTQRGLQTTSNELTNAGFKPK